MKKYILTLSIAVAVLTSAQAQTLQIDPIYVGGTATFEVQNGSPAALAILGYSLVGSGPYSLSNGLVLDLSMPIKTLNPMTLDSLGNGSIGPLPVPSNAIAGLQVWFQAVHIDLQANPSLTTTNMVPITLQIMPPPPAVDMVSVPGGTFEMGDHAGAGASSEHPVHTVSLDAFEIDKYEVSNAKFVNYLNNSSVSVSGTSIYQLGGAGHLIGELRSGLNYNGVLFGVDAGKDYHPAVYMTWYGATLYCNYLSTVNGRTPCYNETTFACDFTVDGFRLPTEAEWEYASRGGEHNPYFQYPWGSDSITTSDANYWDSGFGATVTVGSYYANGYGLYDMAGNVYEWCHDWGDLNYYANSPPTNPVGPSSGSGRIIRGGGWGEAAIRLRCAFRINSTPIGHRGTLGFRAVTAQ